jgi:hypothetical protein
MKTFVSFDVQGFVGSSIMEVARLYLFGTFVQVNKRDP